MDRRCAQAAADATADVERKMHTLKKETRRQHDALKDMKQLNANLRGELVRRTNDASTFLFLILIRGY